MGLLPLDLKILMRLRAVPQIEVDQALIRQILLLRQILEVLDSVFIQPDRDLLLELLGVGILGRFGKIVVVTHGGIPHRWFARACSPYGRR